MPAANVVEAKLYDNIKNRRSVRRFFRILFSKMQSLDRDRLTVELPSEPTAHGKGSELDDDLVVVVVAFLQLA